MPEEETTNAQETGDIGNEEAANSEGSQETTEEGRIPLSRFKQVNDQLREYKALGFSPTDIQELVTSYKSLINQSANTGPDPATGSPKESDKTQSKLTEENQTILKRELLALFPGLAQLEDLAKGVKTAGSQAETATATMQAAIERQAQTHLQTLATEAGFSAEEIPEIEEIVASRIFRDKDLDERFLSGDISVVTETFKNWLGGKLVKKIPRAKKSTTPSGIRAHAGLGGLTSEFKSKHTKEELAKMHPQKAMDTLGEEAFAVVQRLLNGD